MQLKHKELRENEESTRKLIQNQLSHHFHYTKSSKDPAFKRKFVLENRSSSSYSKYNIYVFKVNQSISTPTPKKAENEKVASGFLTLDSFYHHMFSFRLQIQKKGKPTSALACNTKKDFKNLFNAPTDFAQKYLINQGPALV